LKTTFQQFHQLSSISVRTSSFAVSKFLQIGWLEISAQLIVEFWFQNITLVYFPQLLQPEKYNPNSFTNLREWSNGHSSENGISWS